MLVKCSGGLVSIRASTGVDAPASGDELRQAEVEHLHLAAAREEDVGRLDVAMQDAFGVRGVERVGDLRGDVEQVPQIERPPDSCAIERLALEQLHREVELPVVLVEVVDRADVRVIERRRGARLAAEALDRLLGRGVAGGRTLSATWRPSFSVLGAIDDAHAARAELVEDLVVPESLSNQGSSATVRTFIVCL